MNLLDKIEKRRFVGREFLMWIWFESELFEATFQTKEHGQFGLWIESHFVLSSGKEGTRIKGAQPAHAREAKESVLRGKWPESAGLHLSWGERELSFQLRADTLGISGLKLPSVLDSEDDVAADLVAPKGPPRRSKRSAEEAAALADLKAQEALSERMQLAQEFEAVLEALFRDFLRLRLSPAWDDVVLVAINQWLRAAAVDPEAYRVARGRALKSAA